MKRLGSTVMATILVGMLVVPSAFAGIDYIRYHEEFLGRRTAPQPKSKDSPECKKGQEKMAPAPEKSKPEGKTDRPASTK